ncbi:MAG: AAA family ATPase [Gemmatimonadota bacterium]
MAIITISRGTMSGGRMVAECLGDMLGSPAVANEVLQGAALELGISEDVVREKFETAPGLWSRLNRDRRIYLLAVQTALADRCVEGDLVYHGLAGQFLLRGVPGVLRVRLIAPLEQRVGYLTRQHHRLSRAAAEEFIRHVDEERRRWVKVLFDADVDDPFLYELTVNQRWLSVETACAGIQEAASHPAFEITPDVRAELQAFAARCHERLAAELGRNVEV